MKKFISILFVSIAFITTSAVNAQTAKTDNFKVYGNCGMCKKRIEKAATVDGVSKAEWNVESKMMTVTYDADKISNESIQKKIAAVGHDTEKVSATDSVYEKLPGCCLYDRKSAKSTSQHGHH